VVWEGGGHFAATSQKPVFDQRSSKQPEGGEGGRFVYKDPALAISCDVPLGWVPDPESTLYRLSLRSWRGTGSRIVLAAVPSAAPATASEEDWASKTIERFGRLSVVPFDVGGTSAVAGRWRDGERRRVVRRGSVLDLVVDIDSSGPRDGVTDAELSRLVASVRVAQPAKGVPDRRALEGALAAVDSAASHGGEAFSRALHQALDLAQLRWTHSVALGPPHADLPALNALVALRLRLASAASSARTLLDIYGLLLRVIPRWAMTGPQVPSDPQDDIRIADEVVPYLRHVRVVLARILGSEVDPTLAESGVRMQVAGACLNQLRSWLSPPAPAYDPADVIAHARAIVDSQVASGVEAARGKPLRPWDLLVVCDSVVTLIDVLAATDRIQFLAESADFLAEVSADLIDRFPKDEEVRRHASRFRCIGLSTKASSLLTAADESSLRDVPRMVATARTALAQSGFTSLPDQLNLLHSEALAFLQLADVDAARWAIVQGVSLANGRDDHQSAFFDWAGRVADALAVIEPDTRSLPELQVLLFGDDDKAISSLCATLEDLLARKPLALATLEHLALVATVVEPARSELEAAARALLDLRRLLLDRRPDLRVAGEDSLLARQLAASRVEEVARLNPDRPAAVAVAIDHAQSRALLLDLAPASHDLTALQDQLDAGYDDGAMVAVDRELRQKYEALGGVARPWAFLRASNWLRSRSIALRDWCSGLAAVAGATPLTEAELLHSIAGLGEPVLLLYPTDDRLAAVLARPDGSVAFRRSPYPTERVLEALDGLREELGTWVSARARGWPVDWAPPTDAIAGYKRAAANGHKLLLEPFEDLIGPSERLTIVPYRDLAVVPFPLLVDRTGRPILEGMTISCVASVSTLSALQVRHPASSPTRAFVLGDPQSGVDQAIPRLPGAAAEAIWLAKELRRRRQGSVTSVQGPKATLKAYADGARGADLVHLACHGAIGDVAHDAGLVLAPGSAVSGLLRAAEVQATPLSSALVFLATCRGGAGRPSADGTVGLSRAFLSAGASTVVAARWNVPDQATRHLVQRFYQNYLSGQDVAASLRHAMLSTRADLARRYGVDAGDVHPVDWGAFFVLGLGSRHCPGVQGRGPGPSPPAGVGRPIHPLRASGN
jgi:hypothetical protein